MADHPIIYTIMPDYAGAYGWVIADGDESQGVGPNHADTSGWYGEHPISRELHEEFAHWQDLFEAAPMLDDGTIELGWDNFHATGIDLARKLKTEIGDRARIIYEKPFEDPDREQDERREVLSDGSLLPLPSREDVYRVRLSRLVVKIVSGGQTGADRAALDWAISHGVPHGGWCPSGRVAEDGAIGTQYQLNEAIGGGYRRRTRLNVEHSDGTLILNLDQLDGGTLETKRLAERLKKPFHVVQLDLGATDPLARGATTWLRLHGVHVLNVAGPRESKRPGIYAATFAFLEALDQGYDPPRVAASLDL
jgi:hypothetical protein